MSDEGRKIEPQAERVTDNAATREREHAVDEADAICELVRAIEETGAAVDTARATDEAAATSDMVRVAGEPNAAVDTLRTADEADVICELVRAIEEAGGAVDALRAADEPDAMGGRRRNPAEAGSFGVSEHATHEAEMAGALAEPPGGEGAGETEAALDEDDLNWGIADLCRSKAQEFRMLGYEHVTGEEIWECVSDKYRKTGTPPLHRIVNDILSLKVTQFMNWVTMSIYKEGRF